MHIMALFDYPYVRNHMHYFIYHYEKYQYVHFCTIWFFISEKHICASYALFQLSLWEVSVYASLHYLIFYKWETHICFICIILVITMRSINMCILALFDFSYVRNSYVFHMHYFSYHYEKYQYVHIYIIWFFLCEEIICAYLWSTHILYITSDYKY